MKSFDPKLLSSRCSTYYCPCNTLACCWSVKQAANQTVPGENVIVSVSLLASRPSNPRWVSHGRILFVGCFTSQQPAMGISRTDLVCWLLYVPATRDGYLTDGSCLLVALRPSNRLVYLKDGSAQTIGRAATLRQKLQIQRFTSPSHSILTQGRPVPVLTL